MALPVLRKDSIFGRPDDTSDIYPGLRPATQFSASLLVWGRLELLLVKRNVEFKWSQSISSLRTGTVTVEREGRKTHSSV